MPNQKLRKGIGVGETVLCSHRATPVSPGVDRLSLNLCRAPHCRPHPFLGTSWQAPRSPCLVQDRVAGPGDGVGAPVMAIPALHRC